MNNRFIRLEVIRGDKVVENLVNVEFVIAVSPDHEKPECTWVNTPRFSYLVNEPYEIVSAKIESMGEIVHARF